MAAIDYRLCNTRLETTWPGQLEDAWRAIGFLRSRADELGIDPSRIGCHGHSAGGGLCSALVTRWGGTVHGTSGPALSVGVSMAGWADWHEQERSAKYMSNPMCHGVPVCAVGGGAFAKAWYHARNISKPLSLLPSELQTALTHASLVRSVRRGGNGRSAPLLLLHGEDDACHPIENAIALHDALRAAAGGDSVSQLVRLPKVVHTSCVPRATADEALSFVNQYLSGKGWRGQ